MIRNSEESKQLIEIENSSRERSSNFPRRPDRLPPALSDTHHIPSSKNHQNPRDSLDSSSPSPHAHHAPCPPSTPPDEFAPDFSSPPRAGFVHNPDAPFHDERFITAHSSSGLVGHKSASSSTSPPPHHHHGSRDGRVKQTNYGHSKLVLGPTHTWSRSSPQGVQGDDHTHDRGYDDDDDHHHHHRHHDHHRYHHYFTTPWSSPQGSNHEWRHDHRLYHPTNHSSFSPQGTNHDGGRIIEPPHARALSPVPAAGHHPNYRGRLGLDYAPHLHPATRGMQAPTSSSSLPPGSGPEVREERNFSSTPVTPPTVPYWSPPLGASSGRLTSTAASTGMAPLDRSATLRVQEEERIFGSPVPGPYRMTTDHDSPSYAQFKEHQRPLHHGGNNSGQSHILDAGARPQLFRCDERPSLLNLDRLPPHPRHSGYNKQQPSSGEESPPRDDVYDVKQGGGDMELRMRLMQAPAPRVDKGRDEMRRELLDRVLNYGTKWLYTSPPHLTNTQLEDDRSCITPVDPLVTKAVPHIPIMRDAFQFHAIRMRKYTVKRTRGIVP